MTAPTIRDIQRAACELYGLTMEELLGRSSKWTVARPRQRAMLAWKLVSGKSYPAVGRAFRRDHTTVISGVRKVKEREERWHVVAILALARGIGATSGRPANASPFLLEDLSRANEALRARLRLAEARADKAERSGSLRMDRAYSANTLRRDLADARERIAWLESELDARAPGWRQSERGLAAGRAA